MVKTFMTIAVVLLDFLLIAKVAGRVANEGARRASVSMAVGLAFVECQLAVATLFGMLVAVQAVAIGLGFVVLVTVLLAVTS